MAHLLCEMARRYGAPQTAHCTFVMPTTQENLADATGLTSVHVNRTLKVLRDEGVAAIRARTVEIFDWHRLQDIGEFDDAYLGPAPAAPRHMPNSLALA
nr:helix-turn-helix domain-containing protein [Sphingomonas sp. ID1715]